MAMKVKHLAHIVKKNGSVRRRARRARAEERALALVGLSEDERKTLFASRKAAYDAAHPKSQ